MKNRFSDAIKKLKENSIEVIEKAKTSTINIIDQDDNGKLDLNDFKEIANKTSLNTKEKIKYIQNEMLKRKNEEELKSLNPIFSEDIDLNSEPQKLIILTEIDKKRLNSEVCKNSIGHYTKNKDNKYMNLYINEEILKLNTRFYPNIQKAAYIVDPIDRNKYILIDKYFNYLKEARVFELQQIAQDLGAKSFKITYVEEEKNFNRLKIKANAGMEGMKATGNSDVSKTGKTKFSIAAESKFPGHSPIEPELKYLAGEESIISLIRLRMNPESALTYQKLKLQFSNSSGISQSEAIEIDSVINSARVSGGLSMQKELLNESSRYFEYEIEF